MKQITFNRLPLTGHVKTLIPQRVYKKISLILLLILTGLLACTAAIVAFFDPLCCTGMVSKNNRMIPVIDARLQKTNILIHNKNNYNALLLGSSRVEQFKQKDFLPLRVFNYAAPAMYVDELKEYIDLFLRVNGRNPEIIFLGLDFYGSNVKMHRHARPPGYYIKTCSSPLPLGTFLSYYSLKYSLRMAFCERDGINYDRVTIDKLTEYGSREGAERLLEGDKVRYAEIFYGDYVYNSDYRPLLQSLKERYGQIRFVVFTTPETMQLFQVLVDEKRLGDYERWLGDIVDVFGSVYNTMLPTSLTMNRDNFFDGNHLYPEKATPVVRLITGTYGPGNNEAGYLITRENIKGQMDIIHKALSASREKAIQ
jgi:hypothetical protein